MHQNASFFRILILEDKKPNMVKKTNNLSRKIMMLEPPAELFSRVMSRLSQENKIALVKRRLILFSVILALSAIASFPTVNILQKELAVSGFWQYVKLLFSDFGTTITYWKDFGLLILETLPAISLAGSLGIILAIIISFHFVIRYIRIFTKLTHIYSNHNQYEY